MTVTEMDVGLTEELARLAVEWQHPDPAAATALAEQAFVDTVGVALAAAQDPTVRALFDGVGDDLRGGPSSVWLGGHAGDARTAAMVNGVCAHALDFDDVDDQTIAHLSAVMVPTVMAVAEATGASGAQAVESYWVGLAVSRALAAALDIDTHYQAGWHSTGTLGAVAAAAAAARLRRLTLERTRCALGIAGSLAAGSRRNFGTMTKPLHAGVAAGNGVLAAQLAAAGYTADPSLLEQPLGYLALHDAAPGHRRVDAALMSEPRLNVKLHACCYYIHAAADAMLDLAASGLSPQDLRRIVVTGPPDGFSALIHSRPRTGLEGKFSMEYAMAACLLDGSLRLPSFTDEAVNRPEAQRIVELVQLETSAVPPTGPAEWAWGYGVVTAELENGETLTRRVDKPRGHASRPLQEDELRSKFDDCLRHGGFAPDDALYRSLRDLHEAPSLGEVGALLRQVTAASSDAAPVPAGARG